MLDFDKIVEQAKIAVPDSNTEEQLEGSTELEQEDILTQNIAELQSSGDIVDNIMKLIDEDGDDFLILDSLGFTDSNTAKPEIVNTISTFYSEEAINNITYSEPTEGFNEYELGVLAEVIIDANEGEVQKGISQELLPLQRELEKLESWSADTAINLRNLEVKFLNNSDYIQSYKDRIGFIVSYRDGNNNVERLLTEEERLNPSKFILEYDSAVNEQASLKKQIASLEEGLEKQYKLIEAQNNLLIRRREQLTEERLKSVELQVSDFNNTLSKIVEIEFRRTLKEKGADFPVYAKCQCGVCSPHELSSLASVITGDVFGDFNERTYIDKEVKVNRFSKSIQGIENAPTKHRLLPDKDKYRRLLIPGVSNDDTGMVCPGCKRNMIPPIDVLEKMLAYGHLIDTNLLEASKHKFWSSAPLVPGEMCIVYVEDRFWGDVHNPELYVPTTIVGTDISTDFRTRDNGLLGDETPTSLSDQDKYLMVEFLKPQVGDKINVKYIKNDIEGFKRSLNTVRNELRAKFRKVQIGEHVSAKRYTSLQEKNRLRKSIEKILKHSSFVEMCITQRISPHEVKEMFVENETAIKAIQKRLNEYNRSKLINRVLNPTIENINGEWIVVSQDIGTPHFKFFLMYQSSIKKYFSEIPSMADSQSRFMRLDELYRMIKGYDSDTDYDKVYNIEKAIKQLREDMSNILEVTREKELGDYIDKYGYHALIDSQGYAPCWLVEDLKSFDVTEFEPKDINMYNSLYPNE